MQARASIVQTNEPKKCGSWYIIYRYKTIWNSILLSLVLQFQVISILIYTRFYSIQVLIDYYRYFLRKILTGYL